jgi:hypothetical protein
LGKQETTQNGIADMREFINNVASMQAGENIDKWALEFGDLTDDVILESEESIKKVNELYQQSIQDYELYQEGMLGRLADNFESALSLATSQKELLSTNELEEYKVID